VIPIDREFILTKDISMKIIFALSIGVIASLSLATTANARGFGGFHGGGFSGGYHGGGFDSGFHYGGDSGYHYGGGEGGYRYGGDSGYRGGFDYGGYHPGGFGYGGAYAGGFHDYSADSFNGANFRFPTDGGFSFPAASGAAISNGLMASRNITQPLNNTHLAAQAATVRNAFDTPGVFNHDWYGEHPGAWYAAGWNRGAAWGTANWAGTCALLGWANAVQPIYYDYGNNITYQDDQVYYGNNPVASSDQYYQQASTLAQSAAPPNPQATDWTPLGIFGLVQNDQESAQYLVQFAISKSGAVAGNYVDLLSDTVLPIHGAVDPKTQRLAWIVGNNKKNIGETGLYNLMQPEAPVLIHRGSGNTQQWLLVRIKSPTANE
jgi:hypothetical protein